MIKTLKLIIKDNSLFDISFKKQHSYSYNIVSELNFDVNIDEIKRILKMNFNTYSFELLESPLNKFLLLFNGIVVSSDEDNKDGDIIMSFSLNDVLVDKLKKSIYKLN